MRSDDVPRLDTGGVQVHRPDGPRPRVRSRGGRRRAGARVRPARHGRGGAHGDGQRARKPTSRTPLERLLPRDDRYGIGTGAWATEATTCSRCSSSPAWWCRWSRAGSRWGPGSGGARRSEPRERHQDGAPVVRRRLRPGDLERAQRYWPGGRSALAAVVHRLDVSLAQQDQVLPVDLDLEARRGQEEHPVTLLRDADVGPGQRDVAPRSAAWAPGSPSRGSGGRRRTCARRRPWTGRPGGRP